MLANPFLSTSLAAAHPCPHPAALGHAKVVVSDGESVMALCSSCYRTMRHLVARAEDGRRPELGEVTSALVALGYTPEDAERFWEDLP